MEPNKLTQELLAKGFTRDSPPDWVGRWDDFYGGWRYPLETLYGMVLETPCGLLYEAKNTIGGHMSYGGIDWTVENDCYTVTCPKFDGIPCELNHPILRDFFWGSEKICHCACCKTDKPYSYEKSIDKAHDAVWAEADRLFEEFNTKLGGRACKLCSHYNRHTKKWSMCYDPLVCAQRLLPSCEAYCNFLQTKLSPKKGNVYYDLRHTWTEKGDGFLPDTVHTEIVKGKKVLRSHVSITICEAIVKYSKRRITDSTTSDIRRNMAADPTAKFEKFNFRIESRAKRDLLQDLADASEGIVVRHAADAQKLAAEQKRQRKAARRMTLIEKIEKKILEEGYASLPDLWKMRADKLLGENRIAELENKRSGRITTLEMEQLEMEEI